MTTATTPGDTAATLTVEEAATLLGVGRVTVYEAIRRGEMPAIRLGKRILVPRAALQRMLEEGNQPPAEAAG